jgi:hypothetical protein
MLVFGLKSEPKYYGPTVKLQNAILLTKLSLTAYP